MQPYLRPPEPVTAAWLTDALRASGALRVGRVAELRSEATDAFNSRTLRLLVTYSADVDGTPAEHLILKQPIAEPWAREAGADEARFYQLAATLQPRPPAVVPCYAAAEDPATGDSYLILPDLSATHVHPVTREQLIGLAESVPSDEAAALVTEALARHHAYWWNHPLLQSGRFSVGYWSRDAVRFGLYLERRRASWARVLAGPEAPPPDVRRLCDDVLAGLERHWARSLEPRFRASAHLTLIHADAYFSNFLVPRPGMSGDAYLIDWQSPTVDLAGYDLANLVATFWTRDQRAGRGREHRLLERYHRTLVAHGVHRYGWDELVADYRAGIIYWLLVAVQDAGDGAPPEYWRPKMACLAAAFEDWRCDELLQ